MRYSKIFGKTVKETPREIMAKSHELLYRGGFIRELAAGRYEFLPLGVSVWSKIINIVDEEMQKIGSQRVLTPVLHPIGLWKATNRDKAYGKALMRVVDRRGAEFAVGATAEGVMVDLVKKFKPSYKELPLYIHQFSQKFRDELRARGGLLRAREFLMKDAYSFDRTEEDFLKTYKKFWEAYSNIAKRLDLDVMAVEADSGELGGDYNHEFMVKSDAGGDTAIICDCGYAANVEKAEFLRDEKNLGESEKKIMVKIAKRGPTIADGVKFYDKPAWNQIKTIIYQINGKEFIAAVIRGDLDVNEIKLKNVLNAHNLRQATDDEINSLGSVRGFVSPLNLKIKKVGDLSLKTVKNFSTGADELEKDTTNVNYKRDFNVDIETDIAIAKKGMVCSKCRKLKLKEINTTEWGHIFKYDHFYTEPMEGFFVDADGKDKPMWMGAYGIGIERAMAIVVETHNDKNGIIWPKSVTPYKVHLINLGKSREVYKKAEEVYNKLLKSEVEVLWDDREISAGIKFADADLIGIPIRLVMSEKTIEKDSVEWKERSENDVDLIKIDDLIGEVENYYEQK